MMLTSEDVAIRKLEELPEQIRVLEAQAVAEGFRFLTRLITEWENRSNRFDQPGECLLGVFRHGQLIAVGGMSCDPYAGPGIGRLRRVYVAPAMRGRRIATVLVEQLLEYAAVHFQAVRLFTDTPQATQFYLRCGFQPIEDDKATHVKSLTPLKARASKEP
ncbi:GNAT family N-acetyltransferase [Pseudomonas fluorescens]|uniref:GNAT family N-acetyltransferase n=1 Tax=Pseudomonas fluorescens TaxID=294 RepID=UPI0021D18E00|nr:GNAT family N-acetyltransferase [Pseudomonas fluorescens]UXV22152.1 GNAT family N-acetyltransferase [Pseudomonas fluorescens]